MIISRNVAVRLLVLGIALLTVRPLSAQADVGNAVYLGGGAKAGEITDQSAIIHVRLTATPGQDKDGLIPGQEGDARLRYGTDQLRESMRTDWETALAT